MEETALKIRLLGDPVLRRKCASVKSVSERHRQILKEMAQLMYAHSGIGLASPQVGIHEAMIVVDAGSGLYKLINPRIVKKEGAQALEEGCLSIPQVCIKVKRAKVITVKALDEQGKEISLQAQDLLACVLQHEIDHLKARLIVDYASFFQRLKIKNKLQELKRKVKDEGLPRSETKSCKLQL